MLRISLLPLEVIPTPLLDIATSLILEPKNEAFRLRLKLTSSSGDHTICPAEVIFLYDDPSQLPEVLNQLTKDTEIHLALGK